MKFSRSLNVTHGDTLHRVILQVSEPERCDTGWRCGWHCDLIHPMTSFVYGEDEIEALYYCLNCIGAFFREMDKQGYSAWKDLPGDYGGFTFGMKLEELTSSPK